MKKGILCLVICCLVALSLILASCGKTTPVTTATTQTQTTTTVATTPTTTTTVKTSTPTTTTAPVTTTATTTAVVPVRGGILRIGDKDLPTYIGNPATISQGYGKRQSGPAIENLLHIDVSGKVLPWLAKSWTTDPAAATITLSLNTGITFHDGIPFNAAAVKWNIDNCVAGKQTGTTLIKSTDVVNDSTVRINLSKWDNTVLDTMGYSYLGMMISPTAFQKNGGTTWANNNPVGTGPFVFETWIKEVSMGYSKFQNYWLTGKPYLDRIEIVIIVDQTVGMLNFKRGNTDILMGPLVSDLPELRKTYPVTLLPYAAFGSIPQGAIYDSADPNSPFKDLKVRQAFQHAVNQEEILKAVYSGIGQVTNQYIDKGSWGWNPDVVGYPYNPEKAKQLLSEVGYAAGQIKTSYIYQVGAEDEAVATAVKGYTKAVGIELTLTASSAAQLASNRQKWDGLVKIGAIPYPDCAAALRDRYTGIDARYFQEMLVPADYKQAVTNACTAADFTTKQKYVWEASKLFTDKYCLGFSLASPPNSVVEQPWAHDVGLYKFALSNLWTPQDAWKDKGH